MDRWFNCEHERCKFGFINEYGDGWNEPREVEPDCTKMDELAKMGCMNFDFDNRLPLCPCFEEN